MDVPPPFIDTHAHLDFPQFESDLPAVIDRARAAGVARMVTVATDLKSSARTVALAERFPDVYATVGVHPGHVQGPIPGLADELRRLGRHPRVVAIGECGLDYFRLPSAAGGTTQDDVRVKALQAEVFQQQLEAAADLGLNVIIHTRESMADTARQFRPFADRIRAVFHCFVGSLDDLALAMELGCLVSFTGIATFKNGASIRAAAAAAPRGRWMLETDCPFLAPTPHRGKRCEPAHVADIAAVIAVERRATLAALSAETDATAREFFFKLR